MTDQIETTETKGGTYERPTLGPNLQPPPAGGKGPQACAGLGFWGLWPLGRELPSGGERTRSLAKCLMYGDPWRLAPGRTGRLFSQPREQTVSVKRPPSCTQAGWACRIAVTRQRRFARQAGKSSPPDRGTQNLARLRQVFKLFLKFCFGLKSGPRGSFGTKPSAIDVKNPKESENRAQHPPKPQKNAKKRQQAPKSATSQNIFFLGRSR